MAGEVPTVQKALDVCQTKPTARSQHEASLARAQFKAGENYDSVSVGVNTVNLF